MKTWGVLIILFTHFYCGGHSLYLISRR